MSEQTMQEEIIKLQQRCSSLRMDALRFSRQLELKEKESQHFQRAYHDLWRKVRGHRLEIYWPQASSASRGIDPQRHESKRVRRTSQQVQDSIISIEKYSISKAKWNGGYNDTPTHGNQNRGFVCIYICLTLRLHVQ